MYYLLMIIILQFNHNTNYSHKAKHILTKCYTNLTQILASLLPSKHLSYFLTSQIYIGHNMSVWNSHEVEDDNL